MPAGCAVAAIAIAGGMGAPQNPQLFDPSLNDFPHDRQKLIFISLCAGQALLSSRRTGKSNCFYGDMRV